MFILVDIGLRVMVSSIQSAGGRRDTLVEQEISHVEDILLQSWLFQSAWSCLCRGTRINAMDATPR